MESRAENRKLTLLSFIWYLMVNDKVFGHFQLIIVIPSWTQGIKDQTFASQSGRQKDRKTERQEVRETERPKDD